MLVLCLPTPMERFMTADFTGSPSCNRFRIARESNTRLARPSNSSRIGASVEFSSRRNHHLIAIGCGRSTHATIRVRSTVAAIQRHASNDAGFSSGSGRVSGAICQSANVTTPLTAANRRRKASLSPALALSRRRLPISALVVRDFSSGLKDSHVSSNTVCNSWSVSVVKAFIVQTLTKPPSGWGRARRLRTPEIKQRGTPPPDFTLFPRVNVAIKHAN